jgi:hypothetical protein
VSLTTQQLAAIKAAILADPALASLPNDTDGAFTIAAALNLPASPSFTVWKTAVPLADVVANVDGVELVGLTAIKLAAYQSLLLAGSVNPSAARTRAGFDQVFSAAGGATTRPLLLALWKRLANRAEKACATGTGSDASPASLSFEGAISYSDVEAARNS